MNEIFIIEVLSTDYDTHDEVVGFAVTEEEAISKVAENNDLYKKCISLDEAVSEKVSEYEKVHKDDYPFELQKEYKKWPAGTGQKDITPEMRAERDAVIKENTFIRERNMANFVIAQNAVSKVKADFLEEVAVDKDVRDFYEKKYRNIRNNFNKENPFTYYKLERFK